MSNTSIVIGSRISIEDIPLAMAYEDDHVIADLIMNLCNYQHRAFCDNMAKRIAKMASRKSVGGDKNE